MEIPIDQLHPDPNNPRQITKAKMEALKKSVSQFRKLFERRPVLYDKNNMIFAGNMRWRAAKELGWKTVPAEQVIVSKEEQAGMALQDNHEFGEFDFDILSEQYDIEELKELGFDDKDLKISNDSQPIGFTIQCPHCGGTIKTSNRVKNVEAIGGDTNETNIS